MHACPFAVTLHQISWAGLYGNPSLLSGGVFTCWRSGHYFIRGKIRQNWLAAVFLKMGYMYQLAAVALYTSYGGVS